MGIYPFVLRTFPLIKAQHSKFLPLVRGRLRWGLEKNKIKSKFRYFEILLFQKIKYNKIIII
ncbi:MAG: hypothetical protein LBU14_06570 [Candidatus Peribacteria bacterium]|nr:hypothetical protein [Candidatus Peribacteria bacterium]